MAVNRKRLIDGSQLTTSAVTYYTAPANTTTQITVLALTNTTAGALTADVYLIPSGGSATDSNRVLSARSLAANETYIVTGAIGQVLAPAGFIQAKASAGTSINIVASGIEII